MQDKCFVLFESVRVFLTQGKKINIMIKSTKIKETPHVKPKIIKYIAYIFIILVILEYHEICSFFFFQR